MKNNSFKAVWVNPCFFHYRIPVYKILNEIFGGNFTLIYSSDRTPESVSLKSRSILRERAIGLRGQKNIHWKLDKEDFANKGFSIPFQPGLYKAITKAKPNIIISEGFFQWTPASLFVKLRRKIPLVIAYERTKHTERNAGFLRTFYRRLVVKQTDAICCNGVLSKEYCTDILRMPSERIVMGAMAADTDSLAAQCSNTPEDEISTLEKKYALIRPIFLYVGRLIRLKGLRELLAGWEIYVNKKNNSACGSLLLVGDGPERIILEEIVHEKKILNVVFTGSIHYDNIATYYHLADILIIPTLEDNWSLVVPEAMACGKPILCSKYNGCWPELVHQDVNGWVFDPFNPEEMVKFLKIANDSRGRLPQMGEESRKIVQEYSPQHAAEAILRACEVALDHFRNR
jgi:glycosyltransferase involved in cell wall biosynthesis